MAPGFLMRVPFSITQKLLIFVLPLVCLPAAIVGYLSYNDSVERVTRLSREQQLMQAKSIAAQVDHIFQTCMMDVETISRLPVVEEYAYAVNNLPEKEKEPAGKKISKIFKEFIARSPYYTQIRIIDGNGVTSVGVSAFESEGCPIGEQKPYLSNTIPTNKKDVHVSEVIRYSRHPCYVLYFSKALLNFDKKYPIEVVIDLNYTKVADLVRTAGIGEAGYAFMVDNLGRNVAHPQFRPYEYNLSKYADPSLREFVVNMIAGETGWKSYNYLGKKAAAHTPIPSLGWSIAVSIPIEEFKKEATVLRTRMIEAITITLLIAIFVVIVLSYNLLKPVKRLVAATNQIAKGDLDQEIPVKSGDELGILTRSFNRMVRNLRDMQGELVRSEKLISMGRLSAGVAHEIRNPLNAMKGAIVYLLRRRPQDTLIQEYTQLLLEEVDRLNRFVTEFLHFARQSAPDTVPSNLNELLENTLFLFDEKLKEKSIAVEKDFDHSLPLLQIDPHQMEQVFINLLVNALDAMSKGGNIKISSALENNTKEGISTAQATITMADSGVGISENDMDKIFDPFFSTKETGTGLGLPISLGIVENHGGSLTVRGGTDLGTTTVITLPVERQPVTRETK